MIINRMTEGESGRVSDAEMENIEGNSNEYQTADEIYQIMAKNDAFEGDGDKAMTARDLVILYKNVDLGTKVVPKASHETSRSPNQYVETVIYNDDRGSEGSDISEDICSEDLNYVFDINKERIDLLNNFGDTLCHKFGDIQMHASELSTEYDRHFLFNDSCIKEQLKHFHKITNSKQSDSSLLPASLLDYLCSKRLEDNSYNHFYMDNIIKYVQNTIEHLKRISNGDYLTEKVKAKWKKVDGVHSPTKLEECDKIILSCSASIALHVADKRKKTITWDDIVHSEMDVRSISKILEKKIIVEVPKIICGTYRLFSKCCKDNLIITCKKDTEPEEQSQVDVVLKLQRSKSGQVISNIESIMFLKSPPTLAVKETRFNYRLPLEFNDEENVGQDGKIIELKENTESIPKIVKNMNTDCSLAENREKDIKKFIEDDYDFSPEFHKDSICVSSQPCCYTVNQRSSNRIDCHEQNECSLRGNAYSEDSETSSCKTDYHDANERGTRQTSRNEVDECECRDEAKFDVTGDLHCIIHRLSMQSPVIDESEENMKNKKSPTRVRIKSPYENKSHVLEERKRKKLLEIRERRGMKKNAMSENFRITKNKHGRTPIMIQAANSVTKLSITNKYFYNSIYGQSRKYASTKNLCKYPKDRIHDRVPGIELVDKEDTQDSSPLRLRPEKGNQKFINRSYYLDDADTEVKYLQAKQNKNQDISRDDLSASTGNNEIDVKLIKKLIDPSVSTTRFLLDFSSTDTSCGLPLNFSCDSSFADTEIENIEKDAVTSKQSSQTAIITKPLEKEVSTDFKNDKTSHFVECRKSIVKIYDLIKKNSETDSSEVRISESKFRNHIDFDLTSSKVKFCDQARGSRTHIQRRVADSNTSRLIPEKTNTVLKIKTDPKKPPPFISKVTINPKSQNKLNNTTNNLNYSKFEENPLKALSQLIHKIDNVQRATNRNTNELKSNKRIENIKRTPKQDEYLKDTGEILAKVSNEKERRRQSTEYGPIKIKHERLQSVETSPGKSKNIEDLIDEVKELRGEAVRGPSKTLTRLNSLAQPKKSYLSSTREETINRFGKRMPDRLSRQPLQILNPEKKQPLSNQVALTSIRGKQRKASEGLPTSAKLTHAVETPSDRSSRTKPSTQKSPSADEKVKYCSLSLVRSPCTRGAVKKITEQQNGKMTAVGKNPYVRESQLLELGNTPNVQKSKVPFVPQDFHDLASLNSSPEESINSAKEKSTILGKKLHRMIENVVNSDIPVLEALAECKESTPYLDDIFDGNSNNARLKHDEVTISESDHPIDIFRDKNIVTAVSSINQDTKENEIINGTKLNRNICKINQPPNEIQKINNIHKNTPNGELQSKSEIKRISMDTIPKQSLENETILQPGYENIKPLLLKSTLSSVKTVLSNFKMLPDRQIDLDFTKFPMQISTVGYALPYFIKRDSLTTIRWLENKNSKLKCVKSKQKLENLNPEMSKSIQCFKGADRESPQGTIEDAMKSVICPLANANKKHKMLDNCECSIQVEKYEPNTIESETNEDAVACADSSISNINNTTSLDILVGLLNEIKKITLYQVDLPHQQKPNFDNEGKEVEVILNKVADNESSIEQNANSSISLISVEKLQIVESQTNISYFTPNSQAYKDKLVTEKNETTSTCVLYKPLCVDKEINAKIFPNKFINRFTEVPSQFFPVTVGTNITDSFIKLVNYTTTRSLHSFVDFKRLNTSVSNDFIAIPSKNSHESIDSVIPPTPTPGIQFLDATETFADLKKVAIEQSHALVEFYDPVMKMKRDILVTVYSILVFTVFAALSFPEIIYRL